MGCTDSHQQNAEKQGKYESQMYIEDIEKQFFLVLGTFPIYLSGNKLHKARLMIRDKWRFKEIESV